ncbi:MAG: type I restriction endonuclease subunit R [Bacteroidales bacterium]|jgi:type I restriction enzyme R subunit
MNLSFKEDHISQLPALMLLQKMGYNYLSPEEALLLRGEKTTNVLLEPILREQLRKINTIPVVGGKIEPFSEQNIENGIEAIRNVPMHEGYISGNEYLYNLLTLGKAMEQSIDGDKKSYTLNYIDWKNPQNNVFHVSEEFAVARTGVNETYRPDLVLFVNGIPLVVIECKRPDIKDSLQQAVSQQLRNQKENGIRSLYLYSMLLLALSNNEALYATTGTPENFWSIWREQFANDTERKKHEVHLHKLVNTPLKDSDKEKLFATRFKYVKQYFAEQEQSTIEACEQDKYLVGLCSPERLLDLIFNFTLYEAGVKKIARYQQFFTVKKTVERIQPIEGGKRKGGVIWHTQGSGKSLTMVMMAQAIALNIKNPKIVLVTDRTELDKQIAGTFRKCGKYVVRASTGAELTRLLESNTDAIITTVINKFETAVRRMKKPIVSPNIFVLIDEGHRTQYGEMNIKMQRTLPNACFIAMTGTPLMRKEKNTAEKFGGIILPVYTVNQAIEDKAVLPLLYEGRIVPQEVEGDTIDSFFNYISEPLTEYEKTDLKRKFNRSDVINQSEKRIYTIAWNISRHFQKNWQNTGFKAQLVCPKKLVAIRYKNILDEIGLVSSEVLISPPDDREGEDSAYGKSNELVKTFWEKMMDEHGTSKKYEENLISRFKNSDHPEIIIVVDKLLTGFDEPKNTVMYLDRSLKNHTLFQAVARVNRVYEGKDYGYIIDYYGVLKELNDAITQYGDYNESDIEGTMTDISEEINKLPQLHSDVWDFFKTIRNKKDLEAYSQLLRDEVVRQLFYEKLTAFARSMKMALSSKRFFEEFSDEEIKKYKDDLSMFINLRSTVQKRFSDTIDYRQYEVQIQKLIDTHISSGKVETITNLVNIFDEKKFAEEIENVVGLAAKADTIATRTSKHITENMELDPAFYKKFSQLLKETIYAYEQGRINEVEYLEKVKEMKKDVLSHTDSDIPFELKDNNPAKAYFGLCFECFKLKAPENKLNKEVATEAALALDKLICDAVLDKGEPLIDWQSKVDLINKLKLEMEDFLIDVVKEERDIPLTFEDMDSIIDQAVEVAKRWLS